MSTFANARNWLEGPFSPVDLRAVNAKAAMLERLDNKYVVNSSVLQSAVADLATSFDMLEIDGRRAFTYDTCYFDGADLRSYFDHHQGRRRRAKVRMRRYREAGLCFVEVKLKDKRGITIKKRMSCDPRQFGALDEDALAHVRDSYRELYEAEFPCDLVRTLDVHYVRVTLAAKDGGERMTIDSGLCFKAGAVTRSVGDDLFIVETKSANGNGLADQTFRRLHQHPMKHCSKYCTGIALMREGTKHNKFRPVLRKLQRMSAPIAVMAA